MATYFLSPVPLKDWESGSKMAVRDGRRTLGTSSRLAHGPCSISGDGRKRKGWFRARQCSLGHSLLKPSFRRKSSNCPFSLGALRQKQMQPYLPSQSGSDPGMPGVIDWN
jgi:hypothetical protein